MFCQNCGKEIEQDTQFCPYCGAQQEIESTEEFSKQESVQSEPHQNKSHHSGSQAGNGSANNNRMKAVIAILVVLVLVCGGVGGYFCHRANQKQQELAKKTQEAAQAAKEAQIESEKEYSEDKVSVDEKSADSASSNSSSTTNAQNVQQSKTEPVVTHEYTVIYEMKTWNEAQNYCQSQGGHLATATSEAEYNEILGYAQSSGLKVIWLGATRVASGEFAWTTGEAFSFASWAAGEPNNDQGIESYLGLMFARETWAMYDLPDDLSPYYSSANVGFIMEKDITQ